MRKKREKNGKGLRIQTKTFLNVSKASLSKILHSYHHHLFRAKASCMGRTASSQLTYQVLTLRT